MESSTGALIRRFDFWRLTIDELVGHLRDASLMADDMLQDEAARRRKIQEDRDLRRQQDERYRESLMIDRMKDAKRELEEKQLRDSKLKAEEQRLAIATARQRAKESVSSEPEASDPDCIVLNFVCPKGKRLRRRFLMSNHTVNDIFYFLYSHEDCVPDSVSITSPAFLKLGAFECKEGDCRFIKDIGIDSSGTFYVDKK
ncbi:hypothetical protein ACOME3_009548 [Neoechinorhynchus agilis]